MATLAPQAVLVTGLNPTLVAAAGGGDACNPDDLVLLVVKNGSGSSINVTVVTPGLIYGQAIPDVVVAVPAGATVYIDLPAALADPTTGLVTWTYSLVTSITVGLIR